MNRHIPCPGCEQPVEADALWPFAVSLVDERGDELLTPLVCVMCRFSDDVVLRFGGQLHRVDEAKTREALRKKKLKVMENMSPAQVANWEEAYVIYGPRPWRPFRLPI